MLARNKNNKQKSEKNSSIIFHARHEEDETRKNKTNRGL